MIDPTQSALNAATTTAPAGFQRIVVGVDFSESSSHALTTARSRFPGATLRLVHVTDARVTAAPDLMGGVTAAMPDPTLLHTLEDADAARMQGVAQAGEETELMVGDPVTGLLEAAGRWEADLIVVGTHAQGALEHFFLGSTAEKVVARSPIPVLTVRRRTGSGRE
ncbi:universal stress protein [Deinococcus aquaticus]|uniref:universal stress protein n=1 Tax=Deinococcus aquaticus TaxID=328692 RepID=UPI003F47627A